MAQNWIRRVYMLYIDENKKLIAMTRGDSVSIEFSATVDGTDETYVPTEGDALKFAVAKKWGGDPLFYVRNVFDGTDTDAFWTIEIQPSNTKEMKFSDYVWDLQIETSTGTETIIGKTNALNPVFRVWGEVA